jgi:hypothetical protein
VEIKRASRLAEHVGKQALGAEEEIGDLIKGVLYSHHVCSMLKLAAETLHNFFGLPPFFWDQHRSSAFTHRLVRITSTINELIFNEHSPCRAEPQIEHP